MKCLLVPFVVLQELDGLKSRRDASVLNSKASRAIRYIYDQLKAKNQRMQGNPIFGFLQIRNQICIQVLSVGKTVDKSSCGNNSNRPTMDKLPIKINRNH